MAYYNGYNYPTKLGIKPAANQINTRAYVACYNGDLDELKECVRLGFNCNAGIYHSIDIMIIGVIQTRSPLGVACRQNQTHIVEYLVELGANINCGNSERYSPFGEACRTGNVGLIEYIADHGANVNRPIRNGIWPLKDVLYHLNSYEIVDCLIGCGVDLHAKDEHEKTILHHIPEKINPDTVRLLIESGADINAKDENLATPIMIAGWQTNFPLIRLFVEKGAKLNEVDFKGRSILDIGYSYCANFEGAIYITVYLIRHGARRVRSARAREILEYILKYTMLCSEVHTTDVVRFIHSFQEPLQ